MLAVYANPEASSLGAFPQRLRLWLEDWQRSRYFPELSRALSDALDVAKNGLSLYDSVRRFDSVCEHPNKRTVFIILADPLSSTSIDGAQFLLDFTSNRALGREAPAPNFIAGAVRSLLARKENSSETKGELFLDASSYFMCARTYTEALGACVLASTLIAEPRSTALREQAQKILIESILEMEDLGLSINAALKVVGMLDALTEYEVLSRKETENLRLYLQRFFSNLG